MKGMSSIGSLAAKTSKVFIKHLPGILTGIGIGGMLASLIFAAEASPAAQKAIEQKKEELSKEKLTPVETVKTAGKYYILAAGTFVLSSACIIGGQRVLTKQSKAVLASACALSETALKEYQDKVIEIIGPEKEKEIQKEILKDKIEAAPAPLNEAALFGPNVSICYDPYSGRKFYHNPDAIKRAVVDLNLQMTRDDFASMTDYYDLIGLDHTDISDDLGWTLSQGVVRPEFEYMSMENGPPIWVLKLYPKPHYF